MSQFFFLMKLLLGALIVAAAVYFCVENQNVAIVHLGPLAPIRLRVYLLVLVPFVLGCLGTAFYMFLRSVVQNFSRKVHSTLSTGRKASEKAENSLA